MKGQNKRVLLFSWDYADVPSDPSELTDEEFEQLAKEEGGKIYENLDDFVSAFNGEQINTAIHQLRIVEES